MPKKINSGIIYQLVLFGNEDIPEKQWLLTEGTASEIAKRAKCLVSAYIEGILSYPDSNADLYFEEVYFKQNENHDPLPSFEGDSILGEWYQKSCSTPMAGITKIASY